MRYQLLKMVIKDEDFFLTLMEIKTKNTIKIYLET